MFPESAVWIEVFQNINTECFPLLKATAFTPAFVLLLLEMQLVVGFMHPPLGILPKRDRCYWCLSSETVIISKNSAVMQQNH